MKRRMKLFMLLFGIVVLMPWGHAQHDDPKPDSLSRTSENLSFDCSPGAAPSIEHFRDANYKYPAGHPLADDKVEWKVVLGRELEYEVSSGKNSWDWDWRLGDVTGTSPDFTVNPFWPMWTVPFGSPPSKKGKFVIIDHTPNPNKTNSDLGAVHGNLFVKATDDDGDIRRSIIGTEPVKVFFEKDKSYIDMDDNTLIPNGTEVPYWFHYWSQIPLIQTLLNSAPGMTLYDMDNCTFNANPTPLNMQLVYDGVNYPYTLGQQSTNGFSLFSIQSMLRNNLFLGTGYPDCDDGVPWPCNCAGQDEPNQNVVVNYDLAEIIVIGESCGFAEKKEPCIETNQDNHLGIHVFYRTVAHEMEHVKIECQVWEYTHPNHPNVGKGYNSDWDLDIDGYKDIWEMYYPDQTMYMFNPDPSSDPMDDRYVSEYKSCYCPDAVNHPCSVGTRYEEDRCNMVENALDLNQINSHDWSFDPAPAPGINVNYQGKQWE